MGTRDQQPDPRVDPPPPIVAPSLDDQPIWQSITFCKVLKLVTQASFDCSPLFLIKSQRSTVSSRDYGCSMKGKIGGKGTKRERERERKGLWRRKQQQPEIGSAVFWVRSTCYFGGGMSVSGVRWSARVVSLPLGVGRGVSAVTKIIKKKKTSTSACFYLSLSI